MRDGDRWHLKRNKIIKNIEAFKDQLERKDIPNPGGWLNNAIKEGWTKPELRSTQPTAPQSKMITTVDKSNKKLSNLFNNQDD